MSKTEQTSTEPTAERIKTWKVRTTSRGVEIVINGRHMFWTECGESFAFSIDHAARGWNPTETERSG